MKNELHRQGNMTVSTTMLDIAMSFHYVDQSLYKLAPYEVKELLKDVLKSNDMSRFSCRLQYFLVIFAFRSPLNKRQLDGALNRVPPDFYTRGKC